jgi:hypothetical protein
MTTSQTPEQSSPIFATALSLVKSPVLAVRHCALLAAIVFSMAFTSYLQSASRNGILQAPPANGGDQDSYERLGYNLAAGLGFGFCPSDSPILLGQTDPAPTDSCKAGCSPGDFMPTAYRPPGFPLLVAAVYSFSPLNYALIRIINCACCAVAAAVVAVLFARRVSLISGILTGLLCCIDPRLREFAGTFLTENTATLAFTLFAISLAWCLSSKTPFAATVCGLSLAALVLIRSFYVAWYPFLWILAAVLLPFGRPRATAPDRSRWLALLAFCLASLALTTPWWIRNCLVLNAIMPTGTQGGIGIADGFSDSALKNFGSWTSQTADRIASEIRADSRMRNLTAIEFEKEHCRRGAAAARTWMREHSSDLPQLTWWKLCRLWECGSVPHAALFLMMFAGMMRTRFTTISRVMFLLLLLNSLTVMATYHTYERFVTPFRPLIHGFVGCGLEWSGLAVLSLFKREKG